MTTRFDKFNETGFGAPQITDSPPVEGRCGQRLEHLHEPVSVPEFLQHKIQILHFIADVIGNIPPPPEHFFISFRRLRLFS